MRTEKARTSGYDRGGHQVMMLAGDSDDPSRLNERFTGCDRC